MAHESIAQLLEFLSQHQILNAKHIEEIRVNLPANENDLLRNLVGRGWLTTYQANQLAKGNGAHLLLGQYLILDRLGEGGMGQVFKARHLLMNRLVALKVIHPQRLAHPDAVGRFQREIQAAAQLNHPNIIAALHADQVGSAHFLVMEYAPGMDLAQLLKKAGPLPIAAACTYIRQTALGLQHACERGLVHRDIKPSNLLLTKADGSGPEQIKILDMGLARLEVAGALAGESLTREGAMMGTPDYIAPEQAIDSHQVDIRADIYSLGCTMHHLLTGVPPFAGGSLAEKLLKHQTMPPPPLRKARPEIPQALAEIVAKMLAKRPAERFSTPAEVAVALEPLCIQGTLALTISFDPAQPRSDSTYLKASGPQDQTPLTGTKTRRRKLVLVVAGVVAVVALIWTLWPRGGTMDPTNPHPSPEFKSKLPGLAGSTPGHPPNLVAVLGDERWRHGGSVSKIVYGGDGRFLASSSHQDKSVRVWNAATGQLVTLLEIPNLRNFDLAPDGKSVATVDNTEAVLWAVPSGKQLAAFRLSHIYFDEVKFQSDGKHLALFTKTGSKAKVVYWQPAAKSNWVTAEVGLPQDNQVTLSEDKTWNLFLQSPKLYRVDADKGTLTPEAFRADQIYTARPGTGVLKAALSPRRDLLAVQESDQIVVWDLEQQKERLVIGRKVGGIGDLVFSPDSQLLAFTQPMRIELWDLNKKFMVRDFTSADKYIFSLAFTPDGQTLAASTDQGRIQLWDLGSGQEKHPSLGLPGPVTSLAFSRDDALLAAACRDPGGVKLWDVATKQEVALKGKFGKVGAVAFPPDKETLALGEIGSVVFWNLQGGGMRRKLDKIPGNSTLAFSTHTNLMAGGSLTHGLGVGGKGQVWDTSKAAPSAEINKPVTSLAIAPNDDWVAFGTWYDSIHLIHPELPKDQVVLGANRGNTISVTSLAFHPGEPGKLAAAHGKAIKIWDLDKKTAFPILEDHKEIVIGLAFLQGGRKMLSADQDGHVFLWDTAAWTRDKELCKLPRPVHSLAVSHDEKLLALGHGNGSVYLLRLGD